MSYLSNLSESDAPSSWTDTAPNDTGRKSVCITEFSTLGLMIGAAVFAACLWIAIFAVL